MEPGSTLTPPTISPLQPEDSGKGVRGGEEATTVGGGKVPSRGNSTPEEAEGGDEKLTVIPEEAFGVGGEEGEVILYTAKTPTGCMIWKVHCLCHSSLSHYCNS